MILKYAREISPEMAARNNNTYGKKCIQEEIREYIKHLRDVSASFNEVGMKGECEAARSDAVFLCKWILKFDRLIK